ncbi:MAG: hypothetical protein ABFR33_04625, partial [Verrucomicrobiota bacterium]
LTYLTGKTISYDDPRFITGGTTNANTWLRGESLAYVEDGTYAGQYIYIQFGVWGSSSCWQPYMDNVLLTETIGTPVIESLEHFSGDVYRMVIEPATGDLTPSPLKSTDLTSGAWAGVAHSTNGAPPWIETNLSYSVDTGSNVVIYLESTNPAAFFGIGEL